MNEISHRQVACFLEVCRDFHFTKAAKRLGLAQPPLSRHISELEKALGVALFERSSRQVSLTPAGRVFLKEVYQLPSLLQRAVDGARRAAAGEETVLRIGFVGALVGEELFGIFEAFRRENPDTQLALEDAAPAKLLEAVSKGELDGAFLGVRPLALPRGVEALNWRSERVVACVGKGHRLAGRKRASVAELDQEALVALGSELAPAYREFLDRLFERAEANPRSVYETSGTDAMLGMVVAGCGVAILPESMAKRAGSGAESVLLRTQGERLQEAFVYRKSIGSRFLALVKNGG